MCSLLYEYSNLEYVRTYVRYRVTQAEYGIRIVMAASQEYVNTYSTRRVASAMCAVESTEGVAHILPGGEFSGWAPSPFGVTVSFT